MFIWLACFALGAFAHKMRGREFGKWCFGTVFLNYVGEVYIEMIGGGSKLNWEIFVAAAAFIILLALPSLLPAAEAPATGTIKRCPLCAEDVKVEAVVCKHCGNDI